ncbi:WW domain-binding protein 11 [Chelonus insularis]|uniref:WW domain-binding protein 11 n=1 Tax=Chelonus insularis TaxID=460826 RepID=UPI00158999EF|nr:WW domain-binding protein 11 [Chelonus insularis]
MGRRSINTTKSGKYMNPTDQARKEARKKELKKNKKQRQLVRAAVLKGKDPIQIIEEMEKIDQMEYNVMQPPPLNEKVLKDKRKKLKETLDRVLNMYAKDDKEKCFELREQLIQYERRRIDLVTYFEAVRHAQQVQVDEIPLPSTNTDISRMYSGTLAAQIPLPDIPQPPNVMYTHSNYLPQHHPLMNIPVPPSILKKTSIYSDISGATVSAANKEPPGVPPFPPPDLSLEEEFLSEKSKDNSQKLRSIRFADEKDDNKHESDDGDKNLDKESDKDREKDKVKPTSVQQKMLAMAGQDIDQFMREMEVVHKKKETERAQDLNIRLSMLESEEDKTSNKTDHENMEFSSSLNHMTAVSGHHHHPHVQHPQHSISSMGIPPPPLLYRPPPPMHLRMPPPPPPRIGLRLPPGPPPGMPRMLRPGPPNLPRIPPPPQMQVSNLSNLQNMSNSQIQNNSNNNSQQKTPNVLSAAPQLINRKDKDNKSTTTIEAKPQIRNLAADVTRFLPTSLRVKRDDRRKTNITRVSEKIIEIPSAKVIQTKTKDDAYMQFMQEMEGLL